MPNIKKTSDLVQQVSAASAEQTTGVAQITAAVTQMGQATQQNVASSEEMAATSEAMSAQAERLQQSMAFFKVAGGTSASATRTAAKPGTRLRTTDRVFGRSAMPSAPVVANDRALEAVLTEAPDESQFSRF